MDQSERKSWKLPTVAVVGGVIAIGIVMQMFVKHSDLPSKSISVDQPQSQIGDRAGQQSFAFEPVVRNIQATNDPGIIRAQLARLQSQLRSQPAETAGRNICSFLDSKADARTHLGFKLQSDGFLSEAPSLRVFMLDELARLDPEAAAAYAKVVLASMDSPDEWAIALRNLAKGDTSPEGRTLLQQKIGDLLRFESWQHNPSVGYLEAFDTAVYLGGIDLVPPLADLVRKQDNPAVAHAAYLALDRLVVNDSASLLGALQADLSLMQGREQTRANYFARTDVGDSTQREIVERYLLDAKRQAAELQSFASVFPNANFMISQNLLTRNATPDGATLARRDRDALRVVGEWLTDPRFAQVKPYLLRIQQRLYDFARQTER